MKLPDELSEKIKSIRWNSPNVGRAVTDAAIKEAIVRHCAKVCESQSEVIGKYRTAYIVGAILAEFGLDP